MADVAPHRRVSFGEALPLFFKNYFVFSGRSSRGAYWWFVLINLLISIALTVVDMGVSGDMVVQYGIGVTSTLWALATIIPGLAITFRRLHDVDKTAWWILIGIIPLVGAIVLIVFTAGTGTPGTNKFGTDDEAGRPSGQGLKEVFS